MADTLDAKSGEGEPGKIVKSDDEWRSELTPTEFEITRRGGTEPAFTGEYWDTKTEGQYVCRCCGAELFDSETKYDSGSGWPSFYQPVSGSRRRSGGSLARHAAHRDPVLGV